MLPESVEQKLESLPPRPGCYLFRDKHGEVLYVGKAKSLRARVRSYFQAGSTDTRAFIPLLIKNIGDLETLVTATEKEAAILENSLIKENKPRYNVKLRDDKEYLTLRLSTVHEWPRLELVRKPQSDGARYFGPYHSATAARRTLHLVEKHFQLRTCSDRELAGRKRPCLQYHIKRCPAPCVFEIDRAMYAGQVRAVALFLDGRHDELTRELEQRMREASANMEYEVAAIYRDQIDAVRLVRQAQRVVTVTDLDQDVLGLYREGDLVELSVLYVRAGRVVDVASFSNPRVEVPDDEVVAAFLREHYGETGPGAVLIPDDVIVPMLPEGADGVAEWLGERRGKRCHLIAPSRGAKKQLLDLALDNARHAFEEKRRAADDIDERLAKLQRRLRLPTLPRRIECVDISHLGGQDTVGAVVALENGVPDKKRYRTYHVRSVSDGNDYGAMYEVLLRRFRRGRDAAAARNPPDRQDAPAQERSDLDAASRQDAPAGEERSDLAPSRDAATADAERSDVDAERSEASAHPIAGRLERSDLDAADLDKRAERARDERSESRRGSGGGEPPAEDSGGGGWAGGDDLPDLFVVDGGRGQLAVALTAARDLGLHDLCVCGLAKERETVLGDKLVDRVYLPGQKNPIPLRPNSPELFLLARARDEAHRFSNRGRKKTGKKRRFASELDAVRGIGPKTKKALLMQLGSLDAIRSASDEALLAVKGVTKKQVAALREALPPRDQHA